MGAFPFHWDSQFGQQIFILGRWGGADECHSAIHIVITGETFLRANHRARVYQLQVSVGYVIVPGDFKLTPPSMIFRDNSLKINTCRCAVFCSNVIIDSVRNVGFIGRGPSTLSSQIEEGIQCGTFHAVARIKEGIWRVTIHIRWHIVENRIVLYE